MSIYNDINDINFFFDLPDKYKTYYENSTLQWSNILSREEVKKNDLSTNIVVMNWLQPSRFDDRFRYTNDDVFIIEKTR